jgi:hypothetical protein
MHRDAAFREYLDWFQSVTRIKLCQSWTDADYAEIASSDDYNTTYDTQTHGGRMFSLYRFLTMWLVSYPFVSGFQIICFSCFLTYMDWFRVAMFEDL